MKMRHIAIITHEHDEFASTNYFLRGICEAWRDSGMKVTVLRGLEKRVNADLAILHVDLTVVPPEYLEFMRQYPLTINAGVADISKRRISRNVVSRGDGYDGPVIVKTNMNYGGRREGDVARKTSVLQRYIRAVRCRLPWSWRSQIGIWDYRIFDSAAEVPLPVWFNSNLVVERFLSERRDGFYCTRSWIFLGDAEKNMLMYAKQPIIKLSVAVRTEQVEVPDELRGMRLELGFDYGKFDYAIVDGRVVLYDANKTPTTRTFEDKRPWLKYMAEDSNICRQRRSTNSAA
jgi:hypothetical protein